MCVRVCVSVHICGESKRGEVGWGGGKERKRERERERERGKVSYSFVTMKSQDKLMVSTLDYM